MNDTTHTTLKITAHPDTDSDIEVEVEIIERDQPSFRHSLRYFVTLDIRSDNVEFSLFLRTVNDVRALRNQLTAQIRKAEAHEARVISRHALTPLD